MTRVRTNNVFGTTTDNPLTAGATTMNSAGLANLAAVSSAEAIIVLDPNRVNGAPEIVVVTAHTGSATSATIQRGQFGTSAREHAQGTEWVHGPITTNATSYATAADDQGDFVPMNAWETWTPTVTGITVGNGSQGGTFTRHGRNIAFRWRFVFGSTSAITGAVSFTLPVDATVSGSAGHASVLQVVPGWILDTSTRHFLAVGLVGVNAAGTAAAGSCKVVQENTSPGDLSSTAPMTWATGDEIVISGTYEAAS